MRKRKLSDYFLFRHRIGIGYILLSLAFAILLFLLPLISPNGLSEAEMQSAVDSNAISIETIKAGNIVDLPYHALQKGSITLFGLSAYSIKLPSILLGIILGILLILLLNRWFKNNVALISSILTVLATPFLYLVGNGTPLIMLVFWPTLLLWLGSKIQGVTRPRISYCFYFIFALILSVFTPYIAYLAVLIFFYAIAHPHLRYTIKNLPRVPFILACLVAVTGVSLIGYAAIKNPTTGLELLFSKDFTIRHFISNIRAGILPFLSWTGSVESTLLSPMIGLPTIALAITGMISTTKGFFASRNSIASLLLVFTIFITGLNPDTAILSILPLAILTAHGIRYIIEKWYDLFPENPYARIFAILPISLFIGIILVSSLSHFIFGYRYNPAVANEFQDDLSLVYQNVESGSTLLISGGTLDYDFFHILDDQGKYTVTSTSEGLTAPVASLGKWPTKLKFELYRIIPSPKTINSDRIYIYK